MFKKNILRVCILSVLSLGGGLSPLHASPLDIFFNLEPGTLTTAFSAINGAGVRRTDTFTVEDPGWSLDVSWAYRAGDYPPFDNPVFVVLNDGLHPLAAVSNNVNQTIIPNLVGAFGYHEEKTRIPLAVGSHRFGFGVVNTYDSAYDSEALLFDISLVNPSGTPILLPNGGFEDDPISDWDFASAVGALVWSGPHQWFDFGCAAGFCDPYSPGLYKDYGAEHYAFLNTRFGLAAFTPGTPGESPMNPVLPDVINDDFWQFNNTESGFWLDPPFTTSLTYSLQTPGTMFEAINFPTGTDFDVFTNLTLLSDQCATIPTGSVFGVGGVTSFNFSSAGCNSVTSFTIAAPNPLFDFGDPQGFPLQVFFGGASSASIILIPDAAVVPEPGTSMLLSIGLIGLFGWRLRKWEVTA